MSRTHKRIGLVVPANNAVIEPEWNRVMPEGVAVHASRILVKGDLTADAIRRMETEADRAVDELMATGVDVLVYADMVTSFVMGAEWNDQRMHTLARRTGVPCLSAWAALRDALESLGARRISLGTPYPSDIHRSGLPFLAAAGLKVVDDATLDILAVSDVPLTPPETVRQLALGLDSDRADAIVLLATDLPTFDVITAIEEASGRPVVTSNQALLWGALRAVGHPADAAGLGRLFGAEPTHGRNTLASATAAPRPAARRAGAMPRSAIREVMALAAQLPDAIHLEVGEPDFPTPQPIIDAAFAKVSQGWTKYAPNAGYPALRDAIARRAAAASGSHVAPGRVVVTTGAVGGLYTAIMTVCDDGDEILMPDPGWPNYYAIAHLAGCKAVTYGHDPAAGFLPDPAAIERLVTRRTKMIVINTPSNPTGAVFSRTVMDSLLDVARRHGLYVLSDEIYEDFVFEDRHESALGAGADDRVFLVSGVSKSFAMTGWRIGWVICPSPDLAGTASRLQEPVTSCASSVGQVAAMAALETGAELIEGLAAVFRRRRDIVTEVLGDSGYLPMVPGGAFYALVDISSTGLDSLSFAKALLQDKGVATVPGITFGPQTDRYVRVAFTTADEALREGLIRLRAFIDQRR